ncbi:MAG: hypothetical protein Tsb006_7700 [Rickettsiaceae bacterium]
MFLNSLISLLRDTINVGANHKYKVVSFDYTDHDITVNCELIRHGTIVQLPLPDIINNKLQFFKPEDILLLTETFTKKQGPLKRVIGTNTLYYSALSTAFTVALILSNLGALKISDFFGYAVDGGTMVFPLLYILSDILTEVYGFSASRRVIWTAFFYNILLSAYIYFIIAASIRVLGRAKRF